MEKRAAIPVSLPRDNPTQSYWQDPPDEIANLRSTELLPREADVVIIGSGITGVAIAWNLLQNDLKRDIVMLEARQACSGATGRNGGHTKAASYRSFIHNMQEHGVEMASKIARLELANIRAMHAFAREHAIPCDSHPCDTVDVVYDAAQWELDMLALKAMRDAMPGDDASLYTTHTPEEVRQRFYCGKGGEEGVSGGISYEAGSISAYRFVVGLLKMCLERGLKLQTNTPALELKRSDTGSWKVETERGSIVANKLVLATNGYTAHLAKRFQGVIVPLRGHITAQRPGRNMPRDGLPVSYSFVYKNGYEYMIPRSRGSRFEGDIIIGGGIVAAPDDGIEEYGTTDDTVLNETISGYLHQSLPRYFGDNWGEDDPKGRILNEWTGIMGYSADGYPFVGEMPGETDMWASCSFQGHGMVTCWMCAKALVAMMEERDDEGLRAWFPDPFRISKQKQALGSCQQLLPGRTVEVNRNKEQKEDGDDRVKTSTPDI
ncbi:hypothetical protein DL770_009826 [Monosporascus sp. CRB-9-2]|nr:hypothetical protein DL770_009826 [Monosporascus sp. CRB-9-2]